MHGLILLLLSIVPPNDIAGNKQLDIDKLELNHMHDSDWNYQLDQLIFWKIYEDEFIPIMYLSLLNTRNTDWNVRAAMNAQGLAYVPKFNWPYEIDKRPNSSITVAVECIGHTIPLRVNYKIFVETFSNFDTEVYGKTILEKRYKETDPKKYERINKHILFKKDWILQK